MTNNVSGAKVARKRNKGKFSNFLQILEHCSDICKILYLCVKNVCIGSIYTFIFY